MATDGSRVRVQGPLGLSRIAQTKVVAAEPPSTLRGSAAVGRSTQGAVRWEIAPTPGGSEVTFTARVERASLLDRLLLAAGGRRWLERIVRRAVARLGVVLDAQPRA